MSKIVYEVVEHDGGWAYKLDDVFSETFESRNEAVAAAEDVAARQQLSGEDETIQYQDEDGIWRVETADGTDRPAVDVAQSDTNIPDNGD
jgi:hypothetical protein